MISEKYKNMTIEEMAKKNKYFYSRPGAIKRSNKYGLMRILDFCDHLPAYMMNGRNHDYRLVMFLDTGYIKPFHRSQISGGSCKDDSVKQLYAVNSYHSTNESGDIKILHITNNNQSRQIKFIDTGNVVTVPLSHLYDNKCIDDGTNEKIIVRDYKDYCAINRPKKKTKKSKYSVNSIFESNNYGPVQIMAVGSNKNKRLVKFINTGYISEFYVSSIYSGSIRDKFVKINRSDNIQEMDMIASNLSRVNILNNVNLEKVTSVNKLTNSEILEIASVKKIDAIKMLETELLDINQDITEDVSKVYFDNIVPVNSEAFYMSKTKLSNLVNRYGKLKTILNNVNA